MPLYFFHLCNATDHLIDEEGMVLAGPEAVAAAALREARGIVSADALTGHIDLAQRIEVVDGAGSIVHTLRFPDAVHVTGGA